MLKSQKVFLVMFLFFSLNCLKAKRSPFDFSSKNGYSVAATIVALSGSSSSNKVIINVPSGNYNTPQIITFTSAVEGGTIYYTVDGSDPTPSSLVYTKGLHIWSLAGKTIKVYSVKNGYADSAIITLNYSYQPLKTRQSTIYLSGDDASANQGVSPSYSGPTQHSTFTSDYTTTDNATGLIWKSCSEGQSGANCSIGGVSSINKATGVNNCNALNSMNGGSGYAGITNWRLPTMKELTTLTDFNGTVVEIDSTAFPGTAAYAYWSITPFPPNLTYGWYVDYQNEPNSYATFDSNSYHVRCVSAPPFSEVANLSDTGDGTVKDNVTGLIWQKCSKGQNNDSNCSGSVVPATDWSTAISYCNSLSLAGRTWRLPNRNELDSIVDFTKASPPSLNQTVFPNTASTQYWTSTTNAFTNNQAWFVHFGISNVVNSLSDVIGKTANTYNVRCVSGP